MTWDSGVDSGVTVEESGMPPRTGATSAYSGEVLPYVPAQRWRGLVLAAVAIAIGVCAVVVDAAAIIDAARHS